MNFTASDYYQLADLLTPEEQAVRMKVRECMEKEVAPIMAKVFLLFSAFDDNANSIVDSVSIVIDKVVSRKQRLSLMLRVSNLPEKIFTAIDALKGNLLLMFWNSTGRRQSFLLKSFQNLLLCTLLVAQSRCFKSLISFYIYHF